MDDQSDQSIAEQALERVLQAVQRYLPPGGVSAHDTLTEIIGIVDPWPLSGPPERSAPCDALRAYVMAKVGHGDGAGEAGV